jgi:hypothetical protein
VVPGVELLAAAAGYPAGAAAEVAEPEIGAPTADRASATEPPAAEPLDGGLLYRSLSA